jgi:hypothetical protein
MNQTRASCFRTPKFPAGGFSPLLSELGSETIRGIAIVKMGIAPIQSDSVELTATINHLIPLILRGLQLVTSDDSPICSPSSVGLKDQPLLSSPWKSKEALRIVQVPLLFSASCRRNRLACPMLCPSEIVSVAQVENGNKEVFGDD